MASEEQRISDLEEKARQQEAASITLLDIVKGIDRNVTEVVGSVRSIQVQQAMVDARLNAVDARLSAVESRVGALSQDVVASARQAENTFASKQDLELVRSQMEAAFKLVIGMLDERLPKKE